MKIAVITHILHKEKDGAYYSYEPYIREMNIWFNYVSSVILVSPKSKEKITYIESKYENDRITLKEVPKISLLSISNSFNALIHLPEIIFKVAEAMNEADHIHLRCPGNIGLIGCVLQIFFPKKSKTVKYAGNWDPKSNQPWSYNLQKRILSNRFLSKNIKVLVYGKWENQSENIVPFFTASFPANDKELVRKNFKSPFRFIFVGTLNDGKRPLFTIKIIENLLKNRVPVTLEIYGEGPMKGELKDYIKINNLEPFVQLMGNEKLEVLKEVYKSAHFLILASKSEGWPKAIAEAMFFGCIPISTNVSCVSWMLQDGERGILIPSEVGEATNIIISKLANLDELKSISLNAQEWSQTFTLERFDKEIKQYL